MPARDARTRSARDRSRSTPSRRAAADVRGGGAQAAPRRSPEHPGHAPARRGGSPSRGSLVARDGSDLVLGAVPTAARLAGVLLVVAGLLGAAAAVPPYLVVGGDAVRQVTGLGSAVVAAVVPIAHLVVGVTLVRAAVPKFGLAYAAVAAAPALGLALIELYQGSTSTARPGVDFLAGVRVLTSTVEAEAGWWLGLLALGSTVAAGVVAVTAWGRTVMEDAGALDPARSGLAGAAVLLGVAAVLCLTLPSADVLDRLVTDPVTGAETVVAQEGPRALLERPGLALLGGLLLAGVLVLCSVVAPSLRPRLAAVGGLLALAVVVLSLGLTGLRDAVVSPDLEWTVPGMGLLLAGGGYAVLTGAAWRLRRATSAPRSGGRPELRRPTP